MLKPMDYARVVSGKKLKGSGLEVGEVVMVTGTKLVPATTKDPYLQRVLVFVVKMENDLPLVPKGDNDANIYLVDPRSLEKISEEDSEKLREVLKNHYTDEEENDSTNRC